jgi:segregation and condensation protein B
MSVTFPSSGPSVSVVEALLFASEAPVEAERLQEVLGLGTPGEARELVEALRVRLEGEGRALQVVEVGGGFRLVTRPEVAPWLVKLARSRTRSRLSRPSLEALAIIAYRQPVSRPEVDAVRGVNSEGVLDNLLERRMIRIGGRKDSPGRPFLYETTRDFLVAFGLRDISDLPQVDGELIIPEAAGAAAQGEIEAEPGAEASAGDGAAAGAEGDAGNARAAAPAADTSGGDDTSEGQTQQDPRAGGPDVPTRG